MKHQTSRRNFLRGAGVSLALPWLESRAIAAASVKPPLRLGVLYFSNGVEPIHWWAKGQGAAMEIGPALEPMRPHRGDFSFLRGPL
jgi:hypothetical protein